MKAHTNGILKCQGTQKNPEKVCYITAEKPGTGGFLAHVLFDSSGMENPADGHRIRDTWNACHGLDLPAEVEPGILAELVKAAGAVPDAWESGDLAGAVRTLSEVLSRLQPVTAPVSPVFYEVNLSDCDGCNATLHVWSNGNVERVAGTPYAVRKLLPLWHDPEAPAWVRETIARRYPPFTLTPVSPSPQ